MTHLSMDALVSLREAGQEPGDAGARVSPRTAARYRSIR